MRVFVLISAGSETACLLLEAALKTHPGDFMWSHKGLHSDKKTTTSSLQHLLHFFLRSFPSSPFGPDATSSITPFVHISWSSIRITETQIKTKNIHVSPT